MGGSIYKLGINTREGLSTLSVSNANDVTKVDLLRSHKGGQMYSYGAYSCKFIFKFGNIGGVRLSLKNGCAQRTGV
jgi:hypothetical protein